MDVLLDTHTLLWHIGGSENISSKAREIIEDLSVNNLYLSIASIWEIAIKINIGKLRLQNSFPELSKLLTDLKIETLPIIFTDTVCYHNLPLHHRDPFDRILIAQSIQRSLTIVSADVVFDLYPITRIW